MFVVSEYPHACHAPKIRTPIYGKHLLTVVRGGSVVKRPHSVDLIVYLNGHNERRERGFDCGVQGRSKEASGSRSKVGVQHRLRGEAWN